MNRGPSACQAWTIPLSCRWSLENQDRPTGLASLLLSAHGLLEMSISPPPPPLDCAPEQNNLCAEAKQSPGAPSPSLRIQQTAPSALKHPSQQFSLPSSISESLPLLLVPRAWPGQQKHKEQQLVRQEGATSWRSRTPPSGGSTEAQRRLEKGTLSSSK